MGSAPCHNTARCRRPSPFVPSQTPFPTPRDLTTSAFERVDPAGRTQWCCTILTVPLAHQAILSASSRCPRRLLSSPPMHDGQQAARPPGPTATPEKFTVPAYHPSTVNLMVLAVYLWAHRDRDGHYAESRRGTISRDWRRTGSRAQVRATVRSRPIADRPAGGAPLSVRFSGHDSLAVSLCDATSVQAALS